MSFDLGAGRRYHVPRSPIEAPTAMASDETEFDKLLRETREWEARERARHPPFGMKEDGDADPFPRPSPSPSPSPAPTVTIEELRKKIAIDVKPRVEAPKIEPPDVGPAPKMGALPRIDAPKAAAAIKGAIQDAVKQAQAQRTTVREKKKGGGWGWIWILIVLYFFFKTFLR